MKRGFAPGKIVFEVVFFLAAEVDVQSAYERFEEMREGFDDQFIRYLRGLEVLLANNPQMGVSVGAEIRKLLMPQFDHGVFYVVEGKRIMVTAVLDMRRDPAFIRSRLGLQ